MFVKLPQREAQPSSSFSFASPLTSCTASRVKSIKLKHQQLQFKAFLLPPTIHKNHNHCGHFHLSCENKRVKMLEFFPSTPHSIKLSVNFIDYTTQRLSVSDPNSCLPIQLLKLHTSSIHPFQFHSDSLYKTPTNVTIFNCSSVRSTYLDRYRAAPSCPICAVPYDKSVVQTDLFLCTKIFSLVSPVDPTHLWRNELELRWSNPECDAQNFHCKHKHIKLPTSIILPTSGSIVLLLLSIAFFYVYRYFRMRRDDQARVDIFLKDYQALKPTRFSYADLKRITNHFKNKLGEGAHGSVFKGKLSNEILVAVKILNNSEQHGQEFINEVGTMGKIHHINVVRLLGFCADGFYRALVYDFFSYGSLQNFIAPLDNKEIFLDWEKLQQIAIGIARGIDYLHQGCDHRILHFDINPHNVLLDQNFIPKISDFGLAKLCAKNQSTVSVTAAKGTLGYIAPEVFSRNFGNVSYKSDIYSYGMMLLEMIGGRKNTNSSKESFQVLYPDWIHNLIEGGDIHINIEDEEDMRIAKKLAIVGLWCIQWHPGNRPSMKIVLQMLEGEGDRLIVPPTPFDSTTSSNTSAKIPTRCLNFELEVIHELE
ncbi:rust resistance kinase Lr10-like [Senna tora]|uniref:Rust resistance kinase Lr10-like n=1 Tax=Senna tora TaxID=362788 RepID=A0A834WSP1_9FABA|nr:rust resistance kinase Lr10-like [Senna tora]